MSTFHISPTRTVHVVLPNDIDDPATPSGGNAYDRQICQGLVAIGWRVREHPVYGDWPGPTGQDRDALARVLAGLPTGATVLLDGLVASAVPEVLWPHAHRLRLAIIVHMPLFNQAEGTALAAARAVIATSAWTRQRLLGDYRLDERRVYLAAPGVDPAPLVPGSPAGTNLLCVAAVIPGKGHDVLAQALSAVADLPWNCVCAGSVDRDPMFTGQVRRRIEQGGVARRLRLVGPYPAGQLDDAYASADLLVLPSRAETYGMVVTEALARGVPVLASAVGGLPEAVGRTSDGRLPGLLVPPENPDALANALRRWLSEPALRSRLRHAARLRRQALPGWPATSALVSRALLAAAAAS